MKSNFKPKPIKTVSRRKFIKSSAGFTLFIGASGLMSQLVACEDKKKIKSILAKHSITAWLQMDEEGNMIIYNPAAEMGQGSMTSLPVIFAEEMDADWSKVQVVFSPQISEIYGSEGWGPDRKIMLSAGSRVTMGYYSLLRKAGAQTRQLFLKAASGLWKVPPEELSTEPGMVVHRDSGKRISYGELVKDLEIPETLPEIDEAQLKDPKDFRLIGTVIPRIDIPEKVNGAAVFAGDVQLPDMLYGVFERGRVHGGSPELMNRDQILNMPGVVKVVTHSYAIGIISETLEQALAAKNELEIRWTRPDSAAFDSQQAFEHYRTIADQGEKGNIILEKGNTIKAFDHAHKTYQVDFKNEYVYHAQMEPLNAIAKIDPEAKSAEIWVGTQQGFDSKLGVPDLLGYPPENIKINMCYLGGGFGRRSMTDFVHESVVLAKEVAPRPLKLLWTREDNLTYGAFRPLSLQRLSASVDHEGEITGFSHRIVGNGDHLLASGVRNDYYDITNQIAELLIAPNEIRLKHWRSVGHGPNKFAIEAMLDVIARDQGKDPVDLRRTLMRKSPRALATLEEAVRMSGWGSPELKGRSKGIAFLERSGSLSTGVCEISLDPGSGTIKVHRFWAAVDGGVIVQPDNARAQLEGGIIMGISSVLKEQVTVEDGAVKQSNFNDYPLLRMDEVPESIDITFVKSSNYPQGVGESGTPLVACCIANAFLALTGKPLTHLPFTPERVLEVLNT